MPFNPHQHQASAPLLATQPDAG
ncbi:hypothetical protein N7522_005298 [Penicillium canescens]|nr:hypothetical protein N7522_005298 [Penicillium canescens]